jgi:hypothetical protein
VRFAFLFSLFMLITAMGFSPVAAQPVESPYIVRDVRVDMVSESAVRAREKAFIEAQRTAFEMLRERFLSEAEREGKDLPSQDKIAGLVQDFELVSEQTSQRRYIGTYVFRFKENAVRNFFGRDPLPKFLDAAPLSPAPHIVILPLFEQDKVLSLWDVQKNPWLAVWREHAASRVLVPKGDSSDVFDVREPRDVTAIPAAGMRRLMARYNVRDVAIARARFDRAVATPLQIDLYYLDGKVVKKAQTITVPVGDARKLGELLKKAIPQVEEILQGNWKKDPAFEPMVEGLDPSQPLIQDQEAETPQQNMPPQTYTPTGGEARVLVRFATMNDWIITQRALSGVAAIRSQKLLSLRGNEASLLLTYNDWAAFQAALSARGFTLQAMGDGQYILGRGR